MRHTSYSKFNFGLKDFPRSLGDHQDIFWSLTVLFAQRFFHAGHFCPVSLLWLCHKPLTITEASEAGSSLDVVAVLFWPLGSIVSALFGGIFVCRLLLGRFTTVPCFHHMLVTTLTVVSQSSMMDLIYFFLICSNFFLGSWDDVQPLNIFWSTSLFQAGLILSAIHPQIYFLFGPTNCINECLMVLSTSLVIIFWYFSTF